MKAVSIILSLLTFFSGSRETHLTGIQGPPQVKIITPDSKRTYTWNEQVRYSISISDPKDGDSKYGEIPSQECLLELTYLPAGKEDEIKKVTERKEAKGLSLMKRSTCFGCHAHKTKLAGPSLQEIAKQYKTTGDNIRNLANHILNGSTGVWGDQQMPAHPDFTEEQCRQIASYILELGDQPYRWILPGLEGTFRIMDKPKGDQSGVYVLTASYTSTSNAAGKHSIVLKIK
jgi:cytochrome c